MANSFLAGVVGDGQRHLHRSALDGNAMLFNLNRWVQVTNGTNILPTISHTTQLTLIAAYVPQAVGLESGNGRALFNMQRGSGAGSFFNFIGQGDLFGYQSYHEIVGFPNYVIGNFTNRNNQKLINAIRYNGVRNIQTSVRLNNNSREIAGTLLAATIDAYSGTGPINIGRFVSNTGRFIGYIRSIEAFTRQLTDQEIRAVFNYGTAFAAGITGAFLSLDFNRVNGQLPICRAGTPQYTITAFNNTTPDTAGTTYATFNTL